MANHDDKVKEAQEAWIKSTTDLMQTILATGMVDIVDQEKLVDKVINEVKDDMETIAQDAASDALSNSDITVDAYIS